MPSFKYFDGNQGVHRWHRFNTEEYDLDSLSKTGATLIYNDGDYDPTRSPYRIELIFSDAEVYTYEEGPKAGETIFSDGQLTRINYFDDGGNLLMRANGLEVDLSFFSSSLEIDDLRNLDERVFSQGSKIEGSDDSTGPDSDWNSDSIRTTYGNDKVYANGGNDYIQDLGGKDFYDGGKGKYDTVSYNEAFWNPSNVKQGIRADLDKGKIVGFDGITDKVKNIEEVRGTYKRDIIKGDKKDNYFEGLGGKDELDGRGGFDVVGFRNDADQGGYDGVKVSLKDGKARDGFGKTDKLKNIEGASGTDFDDFLRDSNQSNWLRGRDGDDLLIMTKGNDRARGDDGADTFEFRGDAFGYNEIEDFDKGEGDIIAVMHAEIFEDLDISQDGDTAIIEYEGNTIALWDFDSDDLDSGDFLFA